MLHCKHYGEDTGIHHYRSDVILVGSGIVLWYLSGKESGETQPD